MILRNQLLHGYDSLPALIYGVCIRVNDFIKHIHLVAFIESCIRYFLCKTCLSLCHSPVILCFLRAVTHSFIVRNKSFVCSIGSDTYHGKNSGECSVWIG